MKTPRTDAPVAGPEKDLAESQNQRDARAERLWRLLNVDRTSDLDFTGLQRGLEKIDHPLQNARDILATVFDALDANKDGKIQYEEFRTFVEHVERRLFALFQSIDRDHNGRLEREELRDAVMRTGLEVSSSQLAAFFDDVDTNHDGAISFGEWRDFLLFMPISDSDRPLRAVMSSYADLITVTAEGDSVVSGQDSRHGTGMAESFYLQEFLGAVCRLASLSTEASGRLPTATTSAASSPSQPQTPSTGCSVPRRTATLPQVGLPDSDGSIDVDLSAEQAVVDELAPEVEPVMAPQPKAGQTLAKALLLSPSPILAVSATATAEPSAASLSSMPDPGLLVSSAPMAGGRMTGGTTTAQVDEPASAATCQAPSQDSLVAVVLTYVPLPRIGYFAAGALAGGVSRTVTAPLDRLKIHLLANTTRTVADTTVSDAAAATAAATAAVQSGRPFAALGSIVAPLRHAVRDIYSAGGFRGFFAGNGINVVKIMPETAIKFGSYETAKTALARLQGLGDSGQINSYSKFAAGGLAGMMAQFCIYPLDTLKFRLQCESVKGGPKGHALLTATVRRMLAEGGLRSSYRGVTMGLVGMFPYSAIEMGTFELLKKTYRRYRTARPDLDPNPGNLATGLMGAASGALGATIVYPINLLRTRLQSQGTTLHANVYSGVVDAARRTVAHEGWRGLYKGLTPNLLKVAPALSITWIVYENTKKMMNLK